MKRFVSHPLIKPGTIESRLYQESIVSKAVKKNLLCVLPTGLGKTNIAILLAARRLEEYPRSRILVLAPTKPLANQHCKTFLEAMDVAGEQMAVLTGAVSPGSRKGIYKEKTLIFATPQTIQHDLKAERVSLRDFSLLVIDETHHAVGKYAYPFIAHQYMKQSEHPRILALTASPGGTRQKIEEIRGNLGIEAVEIRTDEDADVVPYTRLREIEWVEVELPESFRRLKEMLNAAYQKRLKSLQSFGLRKPLRIVSKKDLLKMQLELRKGINRGQRSAFAGSSIVAQTIKIDHALSLLETQGINILEKYWKKLRDDDSRAAKSLTADKGVSNAMFMTNNMFEAGQTHPKMSRLCSIVGQQVSKKPDSKIIIFANYRDAVEAIVLALKRVEGVRPAFLIGQKGGLSQKEQIEVIRMFEDDEYNVLVGTSITEEGLHLSSADIAIFYEPVPSEIRSIQRRGRVGRTKIGKIIMLVTMGTRDEAYRWTAYQKEKRMTKVLHDMRSSESAAGLAGFMEDEEG